VIEMWIGSYADTVRRVGIDGAGALRDAGRAVTTPAPSFLAVHAGSGTWYAVAETDEGTVSAFAADGQLLDTVPSGGSAPCHLLVDGGTLWVSNYGDGAVRRFPLGADGRFAGSPQQYPGTGSGPDPERQEGPHAHSATAVGDEVWVADLGADVLRRFAGGTELAPVRLPAGCGPRHLAVLPDGDVAVATELDDGLVLVRDGAVVARVPATATSATSGGRNYPSHIALVGELLVVAVRGADVLSTFRLDDAGPVHLADSPVGGAWPRHFAAVGEHVLVACERSDEVTVLRLDQRTGGAVQVGGLAVPTPACVLPA
jgi:6-phosphogluconolactonase (cycloisomerase 2 family)